MKFAEGHWVMRRGVRAAYAADAYETRVESERLTIIAATQILKNRGMTIGGPTITLRISSPLAGVLCFEAAHFLGAKAAKPEFALYCERPQVCVREDGFQSAHIAASIGRNMQIAIASGGERITGMGFRSLGVMDDENTGKRYLSAQLDLDVGECIYGLGERFTPFVKNGQSVDMWQGDGGSCSELAYKNVPFYLSSKGYGCLWIARRTFPLRSAVKTWSACAFPPRANPCAFTSSPVRGPIRSKTRFRAIPISRVGPLCRQPGRLACG